MSNELEGALNDLTAFANPPAPNASLFLSGVERSAPAIGGGFHHSITNHT